MVIDKPAGVVVNRAESVKEPTVQDWALSVIPGLTGDLNPRFRKDGGILAEFYSRSGIVHRLDKETSGCLVIAKNPIAFTTLQAAFKERRVKKTYIALVHGKLTGEGEIKAPIARLPWNRERFGIVPGGKEAVTRYKVLRGYTWGGDKRDSTSDGSRSESSSQVARRDSWDGGRGSKYTLLELYPESGRTHQLRVHLKYIDHPIVSDYLYAGRKVQKQDRRWCPRVFLHAAKIDFPHPVSGSMLHIVSQLPKELTVVLSHLT